LNFVVRIKLITPTSIYPDRSDCARRIANFSQWDNALSGKNSSNIVVSRPARRSSCHRKLQWKRRRLKLA